MASQSLYTYGTKGNIGYTETITGSLWNEITSTSDTNNTVVQSLTLNEGTWIVEFFFEFNISDDSSLALLSESFQVNGVQLAGKSVFNNFTSASTSNYLNGYIDKVVNVPTGSTSTVQLKLYAWDMSSGGSVFCSVPPIAYITKIA